MNGRQGPEFKEESNRSRRKRKGLGVEVPGLISSQLGSDEAQQDHSLKEEAQKKAQSRASRAHSVITMQQEKGKRPLTLSHRHQKHKEINT